MSRKAGFKKRKERDDERLFFHVAVIMSLLFGAGFCLLIFSLNSHDQQAGVVAGNSPPRLIAPDHSRQLVNFSLTDRTGPHGDAEGIGAQNSGGGLL